MDLASGYSDNTNYGNGYTPLANNAIANNNASYAQQQAVMALMAQQYQNQLNANLAAQGPSSGYGTVGGYPSFGDPAATGTYSPGGGLSPFSGTPLGGYPSGNVQRGPDLPDLSVDPFKDPSKMQIGQPSGPDPYYWSGNFFGANNGSGIGQGEGMAPGMGGFNNPAVPTSPQQWYASGGYNPYDPQTYGGAAQQNVGTGQPNVSNTQNSVFDTGTTPYQTYGGADDIDWMQGGSQGPRPSSVAGWGGAADQSWVQGGSLGARPSTLADPQNMWGGIYDQDWVKGGSQGDRPSTIAGWGGGEDKAWVQGGSQGFRPSTVEGWGGDDDMSWMLGGSQGLRPSVMGEIGRNSIMASDDDGAVDSMSPTGNYDAFKNTTYRDPWIAAIPEKFRTNETVDAMKNLAQRYGWAPEALANVIQMETKNSRIAGRAGITPESLWNPLTETGQYHGLTQMGRGTFDDAGGTLNGLTYDQYKQATPAQQIATYGAWIDQGAKIPGSAANLVKGGIGSLPVEDQAAIMMGTQFGPNARSWVSALGGGNMDVQTHNKQADELKPWTINAMRDAMAAQMAGWPQTQSPWPLSP